MPLHLLPQITGWLPILAIHTCYLLSASGGFVDWCLPYASECTSISATGRHGAAFYLFKGTIIPNAVLLMVFWLFTARWLALLGDNVTSQRVLATLGVIAALFLIVYSVALGAAGDALRLQRRIGIIVYFGFTGLAQLLLVWRLYRCNLQDSRLPWLLGICSIMLGIGITTVILQLTIDNYEDWENAFEWWLALTMHVFFLVVAGSWRQGSFNVRFTLAGSELNRK